METKVYNKLVRDRIPDIIKSDGGIARTRILNPEEYSDCLKEKLLEEVKEFLSDDNLGELADIYEVLLAILDERGSSLEEFEQIRHKKFETNGGFREKIFLVSVTK